MSACPRCEATLRIGARLCVKCGHRLTAEERSRGAASSAAQPAPPHPPAPMPVQPAHDAAAATGAGPVTDAALASPPAAAFAAAAVPAPDEPSSDAAGPPAATGARPGRRALALAGSLAAGALVAIGLAWALTAQRPQAAPARAGTGADATPRVAAEALRPPCGSAAECVAASLRAGERRDREALRRIAAEMDALPRPTAGSRPTARRLNDAALEALRADDAALAVEHLRAAAKEDPRDVEIAANLGFALIRADRVAEGLSALQDALRLDPRRTSTWAPMAFAYARLGRPAEALAAGWIGLQWNANLEKSLAFHRARQEAETDPALARFHARMAALVEAELAGSPAPAARM